MGFLTHCAIVRKRRSGVSNIRCLRTHGVEGCGSCWQRVLGVARNFAALGHLNGFLPGDAASSALQAQVVARKCVAQAKEKVVNGKIELQVR